jgi:Peptidase S24-like
MNPREHVASTIACDLAGDVVRTFGEVRLRVFGTSMVPSILPGDLISVQRAMVSEISSGEIVLYAREGRMFAHRVVSCTRSPQHSLLITRGDLLRHDDPPVSSSELLGKVTAIERGDREVKTTLQPGGFTHPFAYLMSRLLQTSDRATHLYVKLASLWASLVARTTSTRRKKGRSGTGAKVEDRGLAMGSSPNSDRPTDGTFEAQLRPMDAEGAAKCRA